MSLHGGPNRHAGGHGGGGHAHNHAGHVHSAPDRITRSFLVGICLNSLMVIVGLTAGLYLHSLALLSDAGHNISDVASLLLSWFAIRMATRKSNDKYTYGYKKSTILVTFINAFVLIGVIMFIVYEAIGRFMHPAIPVMGQAVSLVALLGIVINSASALLFIKDKAGDLNIKGAYMHMAVDALVSAGVFVGGMVIYFTHLYWLDPAISIAISLVILRGTWQLFAESMRLTLDAVPENIQLGDIIQKLETVPGVKEAHHVHVWAMSTTENALTAHLVIDPDVTLLEVEKMKQTAKHMLMHQNIQHATLEIETHEENCLEADC